jgi:hypothetical protein
MNISREKIHLRNKTGFTFAADSLTGYSTWPYGGNQPDQAKSAASFGYPPPWCALVD